MRRILVICTLVFLCGRGQTDAQWSTDSTLNTRIAGAANNELYPTIARDGAGGAIIVWYDFRSGTSFDIYAQRIDAAGAVQWTTDGIPVSTAANDQTFPIVVSDGEGGAVITWRDFRNASNFDIYAQRINSAGAPQWTTDGITISTAANDQNFPALVSDGAGGAIITWQDSRGGSGTDVYAQRVNRSGAVQWTAGGIAISTALNNQSSPTIASDGAGGAIITWYDTRSGTGNTTDDIYAQRVDSAGAAKWQADGVPVSVAVNNQFAPAIMSDGGGGAIITWRDSRNGANYDIYAQRIDAAGTPRWTGNGVPVSTAANDQFAPVIVSDKAGGAIIAWQDTRGSSGNDIYSQRIDSAGTARWTADGIPVSAIANNQFSPTIAADSSGGAIITWRDFRNGTDYDVYAQRVNSEGTTQWTAGGAAIATAAGDQLYPTITADGASGAIITWHDFRSGTKDDIYAQRVLASGMLGGVVSVKEGRSSLPATFALDQNYPNPFNPSTTISYAVPQASVVRLSVYNTLGQEVVTLVNGFEEAGYKSVRFDGGAVPSGAYFYRLQAGRFTETKKFLLLK